MSQILHHENESVTKQKCDDGADVIGKRVRIVIEKKPVSHMEQKKKRYADAVSVNLTAFQCH